MFTAKIVSESEVLNFLGIDYADNMIRANVEIMREAAAAFLNGSVGEVADSTDARAKMIALAVIADMYENRSFNDYQNKASATVRRLISDFSLQLILENRGEENGV